MSRRTPSCRLVGRGLGVFLGLPVALLGCCVTAQGAVTQARGEVVRATVSEESTVATFGLWPESECDGSGPMIVYDPAGPVAEYSYGLIVRCPEDSPVGYVDFSTGEEPATIAALDLTNAEEGEVRQLHVAFRGAPGDTPLVLEGRLTVTRVEGEFNGAPDSPTYDYVREFTLEAEFNCATVPDAGCDGTVALAFDGSQTTRDFRGQCGVAPGE